MRFGLFVIAGLSLCAVLPAWGGDEPARVLEQPGVIERFLEELDGAPPDWARVLGDHHEGGSDAGEGLFALNRARDQQRVGRSALAERVTFFWAGVLSAYDPERETFRVAIGPKHIPTKWGVVRFKPENLPSEFIAVAASSGQADRLAARLGRGETIEIEVAMTGRLVPEESIIYDHAHEDRSQGMIMPVVWVEAIAYHLPP